MAADAQCEDWTTAPLSGYRPIEVAVESEFTYIWRIVDGVGVLRYGAVRVTLLGTD